MTKTEGPVYQLVREGNVFDRDEQKILLNLLEDKKLEDHFPPRLEMLAELKICGYPNVEKTACAATTIENSAENLMGIRILYLRYVMALRAIKK